MIKQLQEIFAPFGESGIRPQLASSFTDFVDKKFAFKWDKNTYMVKPAFFPYFLERFYIHVTSYRPAFFDLAKLETLTYFIMVVKIATERTPLDKRSELQGIAVPTYMQDAHVALPMGGRFRASPFEFSYSFDPIWVFIFSTDPDRFVSMFKREMRNLLEKGHPLVPLDFTTYYRKDQNMITEYVLSNNSTESVIYVEKDVVALDHSGTPIHVSPLSSLQIRYESDSQLDYTWQTWYFTCFSETCQEFNDLYRSMPKELYIYDTNIADLMAGFVRWYLANRGGAPRIPNFNTSAQPSGGQPPRGGSGVSTTGGRNSGPGSGNKPSDGTGGSPVITHVRGPGGGGRGPGRSPQKPRPYLGGGETSIPKSTTRTTATQTISAVSPKTSTNNTNPSTNGLGGITSEYKPELVGAPSYNGIMDSLFE